MNLKTEQNETLPQEKPTYSGKLQNTTRIQTVIETQMQIELFEYLYTFSVKRKTEEELRNDLYNSSILQRYWDI